MAEPLPASLQSPGTATQGATPFAPGATRPLPLPVQTATNSIQLAPSVAAPPVDRAISKAVTAAEGISFQYVPLIQCSFPHADPKHATTFTRKNGWLELTLGTTRPDAGLAVRRAGAAAHDLLHLGSGAHPIRRKFTWASRCTNSCAGSMCRSRAAHAASLSVYANQLLRLIHSTVSIDENIRDGAGRSGLHIRQALFVEEAQLWWDDPDWHGQERGRAASATAHRSRSLERAFPFHSRALRTARDRTRSSNCAKARWTWTSMRGSCTGCFT